MYVLCMTKQTSLIIYMVAIYYAMDSYPPNLRVSEGGFLYCQNNEGTELLKNYINKMGLGAV